MSRPTSRLRAWRTSCGRHSGRKVRRMTDVSVERTMKAPPESVWALVSDVTRMGEWSPETVGCEWIGDRKEPVVGARFKGRNQSGWRKWSTVCTVVEAAPGASFAFDVKAGPVDVSRWKYQFEPADRGARVTASWTHRRPQPQE